MLREPAVDPVSFRHQARDVELREGGDHLSDGEPRLAHELVRGRRQEVEEWIACGRLIVGGGSIPSDSRTSAAAVSGVAPSRRSAFVPADRADVISPGTAKTSRPSSSAKSAVINAPLRSRASTTIVARRGRR